MKWSQLGSNEGGKNSLLGKGTVELVEVLRLKCSTVMRGGGVGELGVGALGGVCSGTEGVGEVAL